MIVGEAQIVVRAITDRVRKDIQSAFKEARADLKKAGEDAGASWSEGFQSSVNADVLKSVRKSMGEVEKEAGATGRRAGKNLRRGLASELAEVAKIGFKGFVNQMFNVANAVDLMGPAIAGIVASVSALASGLFAMGAAAAQALPSVAALAGSMLSMAQAMAVTKIVFNKGLTEALSGDAAALAKLGTESRAFVKDVNELKKAFEGVRKSVQESFFSEFGRSIDTVTNNLPMLQGHLNKTASILGKMGKSFIDTLFAGESFSKILEGNNKTLSIFGQAIRPLTELLLKIGVALQPITQRFATWITTMLKVKNATTSVDGLTSTFQKAGDVAARLGDIFGNVFKSIVLLGKAAAPAGASLLRSFQGVTEEWVTFLGQTDNQERLTEFFHGAAENLKSISSFIGDVVVGLAKMGDNKGIKIFFDEISKSVEAWERMGDVLTSPEIAKAMAGLANEITKVFENLTQGDQIEVFIDTLRTAAKVINEIIDLVQKIVPDGLGAALLAAFAIFRGTKLVASVLGLGAAFAKLQSIIGARITTGLFGPKSPIGPNGPAQARGAAQGLGVISTQANGLRAALSGAGASARGLGVALTTRGIDPKSRMLGAGIAARQLGTSLKSAAGPAVRLGGPMAGLAVASGAMGQGLAQNVASMALMGSLFGPLGTGIGAAAGATQSLISANNQFEDSLKANKKELKSSNPEYLKLKDTSKALSKELKSLATDGAGANFKRGAVFIGSLFGENEIESTKNQLIETDAKLKEMKANAKFELRALGLDATKEQLNAVLEQGLTPLQVKAEEVNRALATADAAQTFRNNIRGIGETLKSINPQNVKIGDLFSLDNGKAVAMRNAISNTAISIGNMAASIKDPALKADFLGTQRESLIRAATQAGATKAQVEQLLTQLNIIGQNDPNIEFTTNALGVQQTITGMSRITKAELNSLPKDIRTFITTEKRGLSTPEIQTFASQLANLDKKDIKVLLRLQGAKPKDIDNLANSIVKTRKTAGPPIPLKVTPPKLGVLSPFLKDVNNAKDKSKTPVTVKAKFDPAGSLGKAQKLHADIRNTLSPLTQTVNIHTTYTSSGKPQQNASGGRIIGPGTGTSDSILSYLSNGEYVIRAAAAKAIGYNNLDQLNRGGSLPGRAQSVTNTRQSVGGVNINVNNPSPERASTSVNKSLRTLTINSGWGGF